MGKKLGEFAQAAAPGVLGTVMGLALQGANDRRQIRQQKKLQELEIKGSKELTDYNMDKQFEMWNKTGYEAQKAQMKAAGLNPALMYGMGGGGGQSMGIASGHVSGGQAPAGGGEVQAMGGMGLQMGLMQAQTEVLKSQANLNNVEATKKAGVDTAEAETRIASLTQGISNAKAVEVLTKADTYLKAIEGEVQGATVDARIDQIEWNAEQAANQVELARQEVFIGKETIKAKVEIIQKEAIAAGLRNILTVAQTKLTGAQTGKVASDISVNEAQIQKMAADITQGWAGLDNEAQKIKITKFVEEFKANHPGVLNVIGGTLDKFVESIMDLTPRNNYRERRKVE